MRNVVWQTLVTMMLVACVLGGSANAQDVMRRPESGCPSDTDEILVWPEAYTSRFDGKTTWLIVTNISLVDKGGDGFGQEFASYHYRSPQFFSFWWFVGYIPAGERFAFRIDTLAYLDNTMGFMLETKSEPEVITQVVTWDKDFKQPTVLVPQVRCRTW